MCTVFLSRVEKDVERKILLMTCAMSVRRDGVRYGTLMFTGLTSDMFMRATNALHVSTNSYRVCKIIVDAGHVCLV